MNRIEAGQKAEQEPQRAREHVREVEAGSIPQEHAQLVDTIDQFRQDIVIPPELPKGADAKAAWEHQDQVEIMFTKVLARVSGAARDASELLVGMDLYHQIVEMNEDRRAGAKKKLLAASEKHEQLLRAQEKADPHIRDKTSVARDILQRVQEFQNDLKTKNVMDYFTRRTDMITTQGLPAEVAPATVPEMRAVTRAEMPSARQKREKRVDTLGETIIKTPEELDRALIHSKTLLALDTPSPSLPSTEAVAEKIASIGGTHRMQQEVIEHGKHLLAHIAREVREAGVLYGKTERKAA